ncbi:GNAT family acetyltransferase [Rothia sp. LK2588]|uniref:GNAT family acetyltransferase n=1 Tax=Rothia sp. LK2588 TaxID=3114369 RepID=UPI0034CDA595
MSKRLNIQPSVGSPTEFDSDVAPREVTITHLEMLQPPQAPSSPPHSTWRFERAEHAGPELARWLYTVVGGPYRWYERLSWERETWEAELAEQGSEIWLVSIDGTPAGYCQLHCEVKGQPRALRTETEILYFGLMQWAHGQGAGRAFLEFMVRQAWTVHERHELPPVSRVWVHTCDLDGAYALPNYLARGFQICERETHQEVVLKQPLGSWEAMFSY